MAYNICFIDDAIPARLESSIDDTTRLNWSNLKLLLEKHNERWDEIAVKNLVNDLIERKDLWIVSAFTHPEMYLNAVEKENYKPEIIIYDWEYVATENSAINLLKILKTCFAKIFIYSRPDLEDKIKGELKHQKFKEYKNRLDLLTKDCTNESHKKLLNDVKEFFNENFSFRFGQKLRFSTMKALEQVLVELGKYDKDFVKRLLAADIAPGDTDSITIETEIKEMISEKTRQFLSQDESLLIMLKESGFDERFSIDFLEVLEGQIMDVISSTDINLREFKRDVAQTPENKEALKKLWSLRLYYQPSDDVVRSGDIVCEEKKKKYYLVISADCDLHKFWSKNFGFINVLPIYNIVQDQKAIINKLGQTRDIKKVITEMKVNSLTSRLNNLPEGPFICPFVNIKGKLHDFIGFPKEIRSIKIPPPSLSDIEKEKRKNLCLLYKKHWKNYKRIASLSKPFLSPLVQKCLNVIAGFGSPDYPKFIQRIIKEDIKRGLS